MELSLSQLAAIIVIGLFLSSFFSMLEAAVISQDKHRLQHLADKGDQRAVIMQTLLARTDKLLSALLLCNNLANVTVATAATAATVRLLGNQETTALIWASLSVTLVVLVFSEISPKVIGVRHASAVSLFCARPLRWLITLLAPAVGTANFLSNCLLIICGVRRGLDFKTVLSEGEVRSIIRSVSRSRSAQNQQRYSMLERTLQFHETPVEKIMTPRPEISGLNLAHDIGKITDHLRASNHSKLLVYDGNIDQATGFIYTLQALKMTGEGRLSPERLRAIVKPISHIPAAASSLQQMEKMRRQRERMVLAVDGGGRVVGLLTFSNFATAIIGDPVLPDITPRGDGSYEVPTDIPLRTLETFDSRFVIPETVATNLNGLILEHLGDVPAAPVCLTIGGWRIEIIEFDDRSVRRAVVRPPLGNR